MTKKLENKTTTIIQGDKPLTYKDLITAIINFIPAGGLTPSDMKDRLRIADVIEVKEAFEFEDADFGKLKALAQQMKWAVVHKDIANFYKDLESLNR